MLRSTLFSRRLFVVCTFYLQGEVIILLVNDLNFSLDDPYG
jgi:hypothetical protein